MPKLMVRPGGINFYNDPSGRLIESHSSTCRHCQHITDFPNRKEMMDYVDLCFKCMELICREPECVKRGCVPYEKQMEQAETERMIRDRIHMQAWRCY